MREPIEFVASAIEDIQLTIRAIDIKIGTMLVLLLAPFSLVGRIFAHVEKLCAANPKFLFVALTLGFFLLWFLAILALVRAIAPLDNPSNHIVNSDQYKGAYYRGGMFQFTLLDAFVNTTVTKASKDVSVALQDIPITVNGMLAELTFEQMKLCFIRDIKICRFGWGVKFGGWWLTLGSVIFVLARYWAP